MVEVEVMALVEVMSVVVVEVMSVVVVEVMAVVGWSMAPHTARHSLDGNTRRPSTPLAMDSTVPWPQVARRRSLISRPVSLLRGLRFTSKRSTPMYVLVRWESPRAHGHGSLQFQLQPHLSRISPFICPIARLVANCSFQFSADRV
jgi:hypothetical protein